MQSGLRINVTVQGDPAGLGIGENQRRNLAGDVLANTQGMQFRNPQAFAVPTAGTFGNLGAFAVFGPMTNNWDASVQKDFPLTERVRTSFRAEVFNFPNHPSYFNVASVVGTPNFGASDNRHRSENT